MIVDTHCHLNDDIYNNDLEDIIDNLHKNNIHSAFVVGTNIETCQSALMLASKYDNLYAILGLYPEYCEEYSEEYENFLLEHAKHPKVVAIGEVGLDYHTEGFNSELQKQVLVSQIKLAHKLNLPLSIHTRESFQDILDIFNQNKQYLTNGGVIHCFGGSPEVAKQFINLGFKLGIGGVCTFKNARKLIDTIEQVDIEHLLLETDAPYLSPEPFRGKRNEPKNTNYILKKIAEIKNINVDKLEEQIYLNTKNTFKKFIG